MSTSDGDEVRPSVVATAEAAAASAGRVDVGLLVADSPRGDAAALEGFAGRIAGDAAGALGAATETGWRFHASEATHLADGRPRRPAEFLDEATERMVDGPYDVVVVVTDVALRSRRERFVPGLASEVSRVAVISTRRLRRGPRTQPRRPLDDAAVRWNGATLLCHLLGHVFGADHRPGSDGVMVPFDFEPDRRALPPVEAAVGAALDRVANRDRTADRQRPGRLGRLWIHLVSAARHPGQIVRGLRQSRAPLLPLSLPKLATAALTPTLVIVFSAEAWDVGVHLDDVTAGLFAVASVLAAAGYLLFAHRLLFPRDPGSALTEHAALVNVVVSLVLVLAMAGLFALVCTIILLIEVVVFPPNLMANWPSLEDPAIGLADLVRTAAFISTIGVLSGALAGGIESRTIVQHLTLFRDEP